jgi:DNA-binding IclR family transcriptional regulator
MAVALSYKGRVKSKSPPTNELAKRLKVPATNISKHCVVLHRCGILKRDYGLYKINPAHLIPGERALDLGAVVIRLDRAVLVKS